MEVQVVLHVVVDAQGNVESVIPVSRSPKSAPVTFDAAATEAVRSAKFRPSLRDGVPLRSRIKYAVTFRAPTRSGPDAVPGRANPAQVEPMPSSVSDVAPEDVEVRGVGWSSSRGLSELKIRRELLEASPRQKTSELLAAAPGFFVDHEDTEGLGNDVYLRGFDLEHGSGIEMRLGRVPLNIPTHVQGQGYADADFIIPETVREVHVLEGPYDPRQGDAAIVGSAYFELGVPERGYHLKASHGTFGQIRLVGMAAPSEDERKFLAFSWRRTDGFGVGRAGESASMNTQYVLDLGASDELRLVATAYAARAGLAGVVRQDDVDEGRIGYYDRYPYFADNQSIVSKRVILGAEHGRSDADGSRSSFAPFVMWTDFRARQNYAGALETSQVQPEFSGLGDLFETTNREVAAGATAFFRSSPSRWSRTTALRVEPGVYFRAGHTAQTKSLLEPTELGAWDRRLDARLDTLDLGAYVDFDFRWLDRLRLSGGPRADFLAVSLDDRLANTLPRASAAALPGSKRSVSGIAIGPRFTLEYEVATGLSLLGSYGEGFRSLDAAHLREGSKPYSKVRSVETGVRGEDASKRYTSTLALFSTWVGNELVFVAEEGGLEAENASVRRGIVGSLLAKPRDWLLGSASLSVTDARFRTLVAGVSHHVPNVPPILFRTDLSVRGALKKFEKASLTGRAGLGYTFMSGRHLSDAVIGPTTHALNLGGQLRYASIEIGLDVYNALGLRYSDSQDIYVSNWSLLPGQQPASLATHLSAAPPRAVLSSLSLYF